MTKEKIIEFLKKHWVAILFVVLAGFNLYVFGYQKVMDGQYQKGVTAGIATGQSQVNNALIQQLVTQGKIGINIPFGENGQFDINGTVKTIILAPVQQ